jgi:hypothetical protein
LRRFWSPKNREDPWFVGAEFLTDSDSSSQKCSTSYSFGGHSVQFQEAVHTQLLWLSVKFLRSWKAHELHVFPNARQHNFHREIWLCKSLFQWKNSSAFELHDHLKNLRWTFYLTAYCRLAELLHFQTDGREGSRCGSHCHHGMSWADGV